MAIHCGVFLQPLLGRAVADEQIERVAGLDEFDQPLALPLDHRLLHLAEAVAVELLARAGRLGEHDVEAREAQAAGHLGHICVAEIDAGSRPSARDC